MYNQLTNTSPDKQLRQSFEHRVFKLFAVLSPLPLYKESFLVSRERKEWSSLLQFLRHTCTRICPKTKYTFVSVLHAANDTVDRTGFGAMT